MNNGLCPACGCVMEVESEEKWVGDWETVLVTEITYTCPDCEYQETTYED